MNARERYLATMKFEPVDRPVLREWGPWGATFARWKEEGMEGDWVPEFAECDAQIGVPINFGPLPVHDPVVVEETEDTITHIDDRGITRKVWKVGAELSMPHFLEYPIKNRKDWEENVAWRYDADTPERFPENWAQFVADCKDRTAPLMLSQYPHLGMMGPIRDLIGIENMAPMFYDDPGLLHDIADHYGNFCFKVLEKMLNDIVPDEVDFWEDICFHSAPLISPKLFREFFVPHYQRMNNMLIEAGVPIRGVDSDGDTHQLIEPFMEGGLNYIWPLEVAAHMDVRTLRAKYGKTLLMHGNIDKRLIAAGPPAIDKELEAKMPIALEGGYVPTCDHSLPPDISYPNFQYYWRKKKELLGIVI